MLEVLEGAELGDVFEDEHAFVDILGDGGEDGGDGDDAVVEGDVDDVALTRGGEGGGHGLVEARVEDEGGEGFADGFAKANAEDFGGGGIEDFDGAVGGSDNDAVVHIGEEGGDFG